MGLPKWSIFSVVLSTIVLASGTWYFTSFQQCATQSDDVIERFPKIAAAVGGHWHDYLNFLAVSGDEQIREGSPEYAIIRWGGFQGKRVLELESELATLSRKIDFDRWREFLTPQPDEELLNGRDRATFATTIFNPYPKPQAQKRLPKKPKLADEKGNEDWLYNALRKTLVQKHLVLSSARNSDYRRLCSPKDLFDRNVLASKRPLVEAIPIDGFDATRQGRQLTILHFGPDAHP